MTEQLRQRLQEVAEPVQPPPDLAALAWAGAARRRRRRLTAGLAVVACVAAIGLVAVGDPASLGVRLPQVGRGTDGAATAGPGEGILMAPSRSGEATLPWARTGLPRRIDLDPSHAVPLSTSPVRRAVALVERADEHGFAAGPVLALGDDGRMRRLDSYSLSRSRNATGRTLGVLKDTSLSPDGRFAAFPDGLGPVVVNLTDGSERRYRLDFSTWDWVRWHPDSRRLLVGDGVDTYLVDTRDGAVRRVASREAGMAFSATGTEAWELQSQPAAVVRWRGEKVAADRPVRAAIAGWCGSAWVRGGLVARSGSGSPAMHVPGYTVGGPDIVVVVDAASGRVHRMLAFRLEQRDGGCRDVLGWLDSATVLLASRGQGSTRVLVWDTSRDQAPHVAGVRRVTELPENTTIALGQL